MKDSDFGRHGDIAAMFDRAAATYGTFDSFFPRVADALLDFCQLPRSSSVLDVGCGRGAVTFATANAVGVDGFVTGIDLSREMVDRTAREIAQQSLSHVHVGIGDAAAPKFAPMSFDAILGSMVLFFLEDTARALENYRQLLKPGGFVGFTTFVENDRLRWQPVQDVLISYMASEPKEDSAQHLSPREWSDNLLTDLSTAGFSEVEHVDLPFHNTFATADDWWLWSQSTATRAAVDAIPERHLDEARRSVIEAVNKHITDDRGRIVWTAVVRLTRASIPDAPNGRTADGDMW